MPLGMEENVTVDDHVLRVRGLGDFSGCKRALLPILLGASDSDEEGEEGGEAGQPSTSYQQKLTKKLQAFRRYIVYTFVHVEFSNNSL